MIKGSFRAQCAKDAADAVRRRASYLLIVRSYAAADAGEVPQEVFGGPPAAALRARLLTSADAFKVEILAAEARAFVLALSARDLAYERYSLRVNGWYSEGHWFELDAIADAAVED
jgi:hypothetical protein